MQLSKAIIFSFLALQTTYALPVADPTPQTLQEICCAIMDEVAAMAMEAAIAGMEMSMAQALANVGGTGAKDCQEVCKLSKRTLPGLEQE